jgi:hypothetical protein
VPILGHALAYKDDPAAFLVATCESVGPIFSINLAGKRMIVVGPSINATKQVALAPESQLSARQAVADIGFNETLGPLNVFRGTDMHKRWIKDAYGGPSGLEEEIEPLWHSLARAATTSPVSVAKRHCRNLWEGVTFPFPSSALNVRPSLSQKPPVPWDSSSDWMRVSASIASRM